MTKFVIALVLVFTISISGERCCLPGQLMTVDKQCQDTMTHEKTPISLACPDRMYVKKDVMNFFINADNKLEFPVPNRKVTYDKFCADMLMVESKKSSYMAAICADPKPVIHGDVYGYCMAVSVFFLILTAGVYGTGDLRKDLFGKSVINLCVSLASGLLLLTIMRLMPYTDMNWCAVRGFLSYYFLLVSFFWMNSISLQILSDKKNSNDPDKLVADDTKRYVRYAAYAWGVPAIFTGLTALINFMPGDHLKPGIGLNHCWFFDVSMQWEYMYSIMSVLTLVNIIVFGVVIGSLCGTQTHSEPFKQRLAKCIQLFVVMGIPWIFEMAGSLASSNLAWEIIDVFNALQGLWIFIVLVLLRSQTEQKEKTAQYQDNIVNSDLPYAKLGKK